MGTVNPADLVKAINKAMGGEVIALGNDPRFAVELLPTGVLPVDCLLGGGLPRGRVVEIYGNFSTLKSWIALRAIATAQEAGGVCAIVDTEHAYDPDWARQTGVDTQSLMVLHPRTGEEAVDVTQTLVVNGADLVVWDSVAATLPAAEHEKNASDTVQPARQAAMFSRAMRKLVASNTRTALLFINQVRDKVGVLFGSPETTPGGKAIPFYASHRLRMAAGKKITESDEVVGFHVTGSLLKSKLTKPYRSVEFVYRLDHQDIDEPEWLVSWALSEGLVTQNGPGRYTWNGITTTGRGAFVSWLKESGELESLRKAAISTWRSSSPSGPAPHSSKGSSRSAKSSGSAKRSGTRRAGQGG